MGSRVTSAFTVYSFLFLACFLFSMTAWCDGLFRAVWWCSVPCESSKTHEVLKEINVTYCAMSVLSPQMLAQLNPECQQKNNRSDAVAVRYSMMAGVARCESSSNSCNHLGLVSAGYTCQVFCPTEDNTVHDFTVCAKTDYEAWSYAKDVCPDATIPPATIVPRAKVCLPNGQTLCSAGLAP